MVDVIDRYFTTAILGECWLTDNAITIDNEVSRVIIKNDGCGSDIAFDGDAGLTGIVVERNGTARNKDGWLTVGSDKIR